MTYERRTANERKTMALGLAGRKAEEEPGDLEAAEPSHRPTTSEPEISVGDFVGLLEEDSTLQKPSIFLGRVQERLPFVWKTRKFRGRIQMECFIPVAILRKKKHYLFPDFPETTKIFCTICVDY